MSIRMTRERFRGLVAEALNDLPEEFHRLMKNVEVVVEDVPPAGVRSRLRGGLILGLYQGVPLNRRSHFSMGMPDKISIYQSNIELVCASAEEAKEQVRRTVMHEIGHHFGLNERQIREAGY